MSKSEGRRNCPACGAKTVEYRHRLGRALATGLVRLAESGGGPVNLKDLDLTRNQWDNFQKLRYFGLAEQVHREDGTRVAGVWQITAKGRSFLDGDQRMAEYIWTYRGTAVRSEGNPVGIGDLAAGYEQREDYAASATAVTP